MGFESLTSTE